jgi:hypothetical protein
LPSQFHRSAATTTTNTPETAATTPTLNSGPLRRRRAQKTSLKTLTVAVALFVLTLLLRLQSAEAATYTYRYFRLVVIQTKTPGKDEVQLSEFRMLAQPVTVMPITPTAGSPGCGGSPGPEQAIKATDNNVFSKWLEFEGAPNCFEPGVRFGALVYDFGTPVTVDSYIVSCSLNSGSLLLL